MICCLPVLICLVSSANAQTSLIPRYEAGLVGGTFVYQGDLSPYPLGAVNTPKPCFGIFGLRNISRTQAIRLQLLQGWLKGDESTYDQPAWRQQRNFYFRTPVTEVSLSYIRYLTGLDPNEAGIINFNPYVFAGISYSFLHITRDWSHFNATHFAGQTAVLNGLAKDVNQELPEGTFSLPLGAGIRYGLTEKLSLLIEGTYRISNTDYMDGFSYAANPEKRDHFYSMTAGIVWSFGKRNRFDCPDIKD